MNVLIAREMADIITAAGHFILVVVGIFTVIAIVGGLAGLFGRINGDN